MASSIMHWKTILLFAIVTTQLCDATPHHPMHRGPSKFFSKGRSVHGPLSHPHKYGEKPSDGKSLMAHEEVEEMIGELLCAESGDFNGDTYLYAYCHGIHDNETCLSIPGFYWDSYWHECHSYGTVEHEGFEMCEEVGGEVYGNTCYEEGTYFLGILGDHDHDHDHNITVPFDDQTCINIHQEYADEAWYFFWELPVMCCQHEVSSCERDQLICEDEDDFSRSGLIFGSCRGVDEEDCENSEHFVYEGWEDNGETVCDTRWEAPMTEEEAKDECEALGGYFDSLDAFTCGDFNVLASLILNMEGVPHGPLSDEDGTCGEFFDILTEFLFDGEEAQAIFNTLFPYKCCNGGDVVCLWESYSECNDIVAQYVPPARLESCPDIDTVWDLEESECNLECRYAIEQVGNDLGCCTPIWLEHIDDGVTFGKGEDAMHHLMETCGITPLHDPLVGCPGRHGGPCPECEEINFYLGFSGIEPRGPVCGVDGRNYEDECAAQTCGETFVACYHECPCEDPHGAAGCTDVDLPFVGHQGGPVDAYDVIYDVEFPEECCDVCESDPNCNAFTWTGILFSLFWETNSSDCYLFEEVNSGEQYCPFCYSGNKLPDRFYHDENLSNYWQDKINDDDLDLSELGYSTDDHTWYHNGLPTCIGWGYHDQPCDSDKLVCAGGDTYGYGADQLALLHELLEEEAHHADEYMPHTRHFLCPECVNEPWDEGYVNVCDGEGSLSEMPADAVDIEYYRMPGQTYPEHARFIDCYCGYHHIGEYVADDPYWASVAENYEVDAESLSYYNGEWFYMGYPTCVGMGGSGAACNASDLYCAGDDVYGWADRQLQAVEEAVSSYPYVHSECPNVPSEHPAPVGP